MPYCDTVEADAMRRHAASDARSNIPFIALKPFEAVDTRIRPRPFEGFGRRSGARLATQPIEEAAEQSVPRRNNIKCRETPDDSYSLYLSEDTNLACALCNVCTSVLCWNKHNTELRSPQLQTSLFGEHGHLERASAWTHVLGALGFLAFSIARPLTDFDTTSLPAQLSAASSAVTIVVFVVSTCYHVFGPIREFTGWLRVSDHGAIYVGLAVASVADVAIATRGFENIQWQTVADPIFVAATLACYFIYRRAVLPQSQTELAWGECALGLWRFQHSDFEHGALRSAGYATLSFCFLLLVPTMYANLADSSAATMLGCNGAAVGLLVLGLLWDNVLIWPDRMYEYRYYHFLSTDDIPCHSKSLGCIMSSHALWHVATILSILVLTIGREVVIHHEEF